ncbi:MAG: lysine--tRNA ligase [Acidimicrobiia bacterium]|nr:lysine--tRNA ligase [Acidimicrobiia bacterium]
MTDHPDDQTEPLEDLDDATPLLDHPLTAVRVGKLESIRAQGIDPYPHVFHRDTHAADIHRRYADLEPGAETGDPAVVAGRIMNIRSFGKLRFAVLQDTSGRIQLFVSKAVLGDEGIALFDQIDVGDWVGASGEVVSTKKGELSVKVAEVQLLAKALRPLPDKWHGLQDTERRYRQRYLDLLVNPEARATALARAATVRSLRRSFEERGYLEVETPMLQIRPGGALAKPFKTHHKALGVDMYLRIAPELYLKRLTIGGLEKVFEINRNFRNEGIDATHSPEFTMLESYEAFADYHDIMELTEQVIARAAVDVTGSMVIEYQGRQVDLTPPWQRVSMVEAVSARLGIHIDLMTSVDDLRSIAADLGVEVHTGWGAGKLIAEIFEAVVEPDLWEPTIVIDYPTEISPLSKKHRSKPGVTERFEAFIAGRELANAFTELNDPMDQRRRFEDQARARAAGDDEAHPIDEDYIRALEYGLPPTGGLGIGVDRLVMLLTDHATIREVVLFPHLRPEVGGTATAHERPDTSEMTGVVTPPD